MSDDVKNQHYCPEFYLKGFTNSSKKLWRFDKTNKYNPFLDVFPSQIMFEPYFYKIGDDNTVETQLFKRLENNWAPLFKEILKKIDSKSLEQPEFDLLVEFIAWQWARTPLFLNEIDRLYPNLAKDEKFILIFKNVISFQSSFISKTLTFYRTTADLPYLTSDNPCFNYLNYPVHFIPLCSEIMLTWENSIDGKLKIQHAVAPEKLVVKVNDLIVSDSRKYVVGSDKTILEQSVENTKNNPGFMEKL